MTEAIWLTGTDFATHVRYIADRLSPRRQRLLAAAFCRVGLQFVENTGLAAALRTIEDAADEGVTSPTLDETRQYCREIAITAAEHYRLAVEAGRTAEGFPAHCQSQFAWSLAYAANYPVPLIEIGTQIASIAVDVASGSVGYPMIPSTGNRVVAWQNEAIRLRTVVWEVVGNPFRPVEFAPQWRTDTVVTLAHTMYQNGDFAAMPILADALQDAGCEDEQILTHCRTAASHVRGCWVLDLVLGKQ